MRLSKLSYYADFVVYPVVIVALAAADAGHVTWHESALNGSCAATGGFGDSGRCWSMSCTARAASNTPILAHARRASCCAAGLHRHAVMGQRVGAQPGVSVSRLVLAGLQRRRRTHRRRDARLLVVRRACITWSITTRTPLRPPTSTSSAPGTCGTTTRRRAETSASPRPIWDYVFGTAIRARGKVMASS